MLASSLLLRLIQFTFVVMIIKVLCTLILESVGNTLSHMTSSCAEPIPEGTVAYRGSVLQTPEIQPRLVTAKVWVFSEILAFQFYVIRPLTSRLHMNVILHYNGGARMTCLFF